MYSNLSSFIQLFLAFTSLINISVSQQSNCIPYPSYLQANQRSIHKTLTRDSTRLFYNINDNGYFHKYDFKNRHFNNSSELSSEFRPHPFHDIYNYQSNSSRILLKPTGVNLDWIRHYNPVDIPALDFAEDIVCDSQNNIYVTGHTTRMPNGFDIYTIKYDPQGVELWSTYYNSGVNSDDHAVGIEIDNKGDIYVMGCKHGWNLKDASIFLIKYDNRGKKKWVFQDSLRAYSSINMTLSKEGHIFLFYSQSSNCNGVKICKLDPRGNLLWKTCYNGKKCKPIFVTGKVYKNNVYVTWSYPYSPCNRENIVVKYTTTGSLLWQESFYYANETYLYNRGLDIDKNGDLYLLSEIRGSQRIGVLVKYNSEGKLLWKQKFGALKEPYVGFHDKMIDDSCHIYIVMILNNKSIALIKYNANGVKEWEAEYQNSDYNFLVYFSLAIDSHGNPVISGPCEFKNASGNDYNNFYFTVKFNSLGQVIWSKFEEYGSNVPGIATDTSDNVIVCGSANDSGTGMDYLTVKYNTDGIKQWIRKFNGESRFIGGTNDIISDLQGNVYTAGYGPAGAALVKYNSSGDLIWSCQESGCDFEYIGIDHKGNIYAASNYGITLHKIINGRTAWIQNCDIINDQGNPTAFCNGMVVDDKGNTYLICSREADNYLSELNTISYDTKGNLRWINRHSPEGPCSITYGCDIAMDINDNIIVGGYTWNRPNSYFLTIKYNSQGSVLWVKNYGEDCGIRAITVDGWGNIYCTGFIESVFEKDGERSFLTVKYSPDGELKWSARHIVQNTSYGDHYEIEAGIYGNIYVLITYKQDQRNLYDLVKYNAKGEKQWIVTEEDVSIDDMVIGRKGNIYITGNLCWNGWKISKEVCTTKYTLWGEKRWQMIYNGGGTTKTKSKAVTVDRRGNVYLALTMNGYEWSQFITLKYVQTNHDNLHSLLNEKYSLSQNQPNPFNNETLITYNLAKEQDVKFNIFNNLGQLVFTKSMGLRHAGQNIFYFKAPKLLSSGIYFYQLETPKIIKTGKMTLVR